MCDKHQVLGNDFADTCLAALYLKSEPGVQQHCRFEQKVAKELVYNILVLDHLIYFLFPNV
jgi:hypothetical protein